MEIPDRTRFDATTRNHRRGEGKEPGRMPSRFQAAAGPVVRYCRAKTYAFALEPLCIMTMSGPPRVDGSNATPFPDPALIAEMERIPEPAVLFLPGGRIAAINPATARLAGIPLIGMTVAEALGRYGGRRSDGSPIIRGDLPCARALRGEIVDQGERLDLNLPDGSLYRAWVTSAPVVVEGKVVAALSVLHDFDAYVRGLASPPPDADRPGEVR